MPSLVASLLIFLAVGVAFLGANLLVGWLVRPRKPDPAKGVVYECGEEPVGDARVQFDLRFYVVALLFIVFDVEIAFFFPWAVVFGSATRAADPTLPADQQAAALANLGGSADPAAMTGLATLAFVELAVFFGVLLVGFAYLWKRGDLEFVRATAGQGR
jgi:NADH-quinone oxidoreductase subunit A